MNEFNKYKKVVCNRVNNKKILELNNSRFLATSRTQINNDSNNINGNSSLFTNEVLIKSIAKNTSPYNTFFPITKPKTKNILCWENKKHKKLTKNKLLITGNNSNIFNRTKIYLSRITNSNTNTNSFNKTNSLKNLNNKTNYFTKTKQNKKINSENNENIILNAKKESNKSKEKMKLLKFKLNRILKENCLNICDTFEQKNDTFNIKLKNYFNSEKYIRGKKVEHDNLNQNKKGFSSSHDLLNYYYEPSIDKNTNEELMACSIVNNLSEDEKKIVFLNPKYFLIDNKKVLIKKLNIILNESLKDRLLREEKLSKANEEHNQHEENKTDINNNIKKIFNKKIRNKTDIFNEKKINNKLSEYHHNNFVKTMSKNKLIDYINSGIKDYYKKFYSFCHKNFMENTSLCQEGDYNYKMFNYPLHFKMTKEYYLNKNSFRLEKEKNFHIYNLRKKNKKDALINRIKSCQNIIKKNYEKK